MGRDRTASGPLRSAAAAARKRPCRRLPPEPFGHDLPPEAVLLDAGGVFVLSEHDRMLGAFITRAGWAPDAGVLDAAPATGCRRR